MTANQNAAPRINRFVWTFDAYPYRVVPEDDGLALDFPDFPEIACFIPHDENDRDIEAYALDAVIAALRGRIERRQPVPVGDSRAGNVVRIPFLAQNKLALYHGLVERGLSNRAFAKMLGKSEGIVRRLLDLDHESSYRSLAAALDSIGIRHQERVEFLAEAV